jgi:metal-responsive CopG/Arc/MetJ family transcriptional regulator
MANEPRKGQYLIRPSYYDAMYHQFDDLKNTGYDWRNNIIKRSVSSYILSDSKREAIIIRMQSLIVYIMDYASNIKKAFNYAADKNYKHLN